MAAFSVHHIRKVILPDRHVAWWVLPIAFAAGIVSFEIGSVPVAGVSWWWVTMSVLLFGQGIKVVEKSVVEAVHL